MKPSPKKPKTKKFVGYVPKGETIAETLEAFKEYSVATSKYFGMYDDPDDILRDGMKAVKRTITLTWEDEEVKEKT